MYRGFSEPAIMECPLANSRFSETSRPRDRKGQPKGCRFPEMLNGKTKTKGAYKKNRRKSGRAKNERSLFLHANGPRSSKDTRKKSKVFNETR